MKKAIVTINITIYTLKLLSFILFAEYLEAGDLAVLGSVFWSITLLLIDSIYMFQRKCLNRLRICLLYIGMAILEILIVYILIKINWIDQHIGFMGLGTHRLEYLFMGISNVVSCVIIIVLYAIGMW